ncbi:class I mannose-6-phosphate isomerase [Flavobacterium amniphilum]|uniref:type I phosphomannose isomerase catalytic subunit n=1 Tax=Flavobacterium amniphilum TaxID=1834035 RepID=UPI002029EA72|nr:type I phosphomannose isomerase catalytic subunit [Flavobacterium amniphilum]MCL9806188.1 class I mannose-6-phosphate isomerase [Flavobacterium amniphilum]
MELELYPLIFKPIFKDRIWGGTKLQSVLNKNIPNDTTGESWELSTVSGDVSQIANGYWKDKSLQDLIAAYPVELLGEKVYLQFGKQFPLLFKFLDAKEDLSIQLHPNDELAQKRHNSFGKTEMWYVMQADEGSRLIVGFKEKATPQKYLQHLEDKTLTSILEEIPVKQGDVFLLETGTIHAIGAGIVIAEIQQTSDITYRIYDFDRKDANGNLRELHVDLALEAINYGVVDAKKEYISEINKSNLAVDCPYFTTNIIPLEGQMVITKNTDSFVVYMCTEGKLEIKVKQQTYQFQKGDTILIPAFLTDYQLIGSSELLEIFIS